MGVRTLAEFRFRLNRALRQAGGEKEQEGNELLDQWINEAVLEIPAIIDLESRRSPTTVPTVIDQSAYVVDTTLVGLCMVKDNTSWRVFSYRFSLVFHDIQIYSPAILIAS